jgi:hypothetical protein
MLIMLIDQMQKKKEVAVKNGTCMISFQWLYMFISFLEKN